MGEECTSRDAVNVHFHRVHPEGHECGEGFEVSDCDGGVIVVGEKDGKYAMRLRGPVECALD